MAQGENDSRAGKGVDSKGEPVFDPTKNVLDLVEAAVKRQDDLRIEITQRIDAGLIHEKELAEVRDKCTKDMAILREQHSKEIRTLESDRLDKIRQVDVLAGNTAADRALVAIQTLATSQAAAAETLRSMVTSTATTIATQTSQTMAIVTERIAALEKSSYEGAGRKTLSDPAMVELLAEMKIMKTAQATGGGKSEGIKDVQTTQATSNSFVVAVVAVIISFVLGAGGLIVALMK